MSFAERFGQFGKSRLVEIAEGGTGADRPEVARDNLATCGLADANTWTGSPNIFEGDVVFNGSIEHNNDLVINVTPSGLKRIIFNDTSNGRQLIIGLESALLASNQIDLPYNQSGRPALWPNAAARGALLYRSSSAAVPSGQLPIGTAGQFLKAGANDPEWSNLSVAPVDLSNQSAAIGATNLVAAASGAYRVSANLEVTTGDATAGTVDVVIRWTDRNGARNKQVIPATSMVAVASPDGADIFLRADSGALTFETNVVGAVNNARYALTIRTEPIT